MLNPKNLKLWLIVVVAPAPALADTFAPAPGEGAAPAFAPAPAPERKKPRGSRVILGAAAAVVLLVVLAVVAACAFFLSPRRQLERAIAKSAAAYAAAGKNLGLSELSGLAETDPASRRFSLVLNHIEPGEAAYYDLSALQGFGISAQADTDRQGQKIDASSKIFWNELDLLTLNLQADGNNLYLSSPEWTRGAVYGLNTETLGADLDRLGLNTGEADLSQISFDLFDLKESAGPDERQQKELRDAAAASAKRLLDAVEVEKGGKTSMRVNDQTLSAAVYHVLIPEDALQDYLDTLLDLAQPLDQNAEARRMLAAMGLDEESVDSILPGLDTEARYDKAARTLQEAVEALGDLKLTVAVSGGRVCAVEYAGRVGESEAEVGLYLGGGKNYVDDLSLEVTVDGETFSLDSTGSHTGRDGVFTDKTSIQAGQDKLAFELRYEPGASGNNLRWEGMQAGSVVSMSIEGRLAVSRDTLDLALEEISYRLGGDPYISAGLVYYQGPCEKVEPSVSSPRMLAGMDEEELEALFEKLSDNTDEWAYSLMMSLYEPAGLL